MRWAAENDAYAVFGPAMMTATASELRHAVFMVYVVPPRSTLCDAIFGLSEDAGAGFRMRESAGRILSFADSILGPKPANDISADRAPPRDLTVAPRRREVFQTRNTAAN